jgi:hypothetical protein
LGVPGFDEYYGYGRINARKAIQETWPDHDVLIFNHEMPEYARLGNPVLFNATVLNYGRNAEEGIHVELLVDGRFSSVTDISGLALGGIETVSLSWNPPQKGAYNVTLYVQPVTGQNSTEKDAVSEMVDVIPDRGNVVFEEAHLSLYTIGNNPAGDVSGGYEDFANSLISNGYNVLTINPGTLVSPSSLVLANVLVIVAPQIGYSAFELDTIENWVKSGGRLLLVSEAQIYGSSAGIVAEGFNITLAGDRIANYVKNVGAPPWPYYDGSNIRPHPITVGVTRVEMYAGDGIISLSDGETQLIVTDSDGSAEWSNHAPAINVSVMSAFDKGVAGSGRIVVSTDSNLWDSAYDVGDEGTLDFWHCDNHILALNVINWLSARPQHELAVSLNAPSYAEPGSKLLIEATVSNEGLNNETNVAVQLLINGVAVQNETLGFLANGTHYTFDYPFSSNVETTCNVTAYAPPLQGENVTLNNVCSITVRIRYMPRILAYLQYVDYAQEYYNTFEAIDSTFGSNYNLTGLWNYTQLDSMLAEKDILLIPEQEHANVSTMETIVSAWSKTLLEFVENGGIIIACDHASQTYRVFAGTGLLSINGVTDQTGNVLYLNDSEDPLAKNVSLSFIAPNDTVGFVLQEAKTFVGNGTFPVVVDKKLGQGYIVLLGFDFYESNVDTEWILGNAVGLLATPTSFENWAQGFSHHYMR